MRLAVLAMAVAAVLSAGCGSSDAPDDPGSAVAQAPTGASVKGTLLPPEGASPHFVLNGPGARSGDTVVIEAPYVNWFTDRPKRRVGRMSIVEFAENWERYGFAEHPPSAEIAGPGTDAVAVVSDGATKNGAFSLSVDETVDGTVAQGHLGEISVVVDSRSGAPTLIERVRDAAGTGASRLPVSVSKNRSR